MRVRALRQVFHEGQLRRIDDVFDLRSVSTFRATHMVRVADDEPRALGPRGRLLQRMTRDPLRFQRERAQTSRARLGRTSKAEAASCAVRSTTAKE